MRDFFRVASRLKKREINKSLNNGGLAGCFHLEQPALTFIRDPWEMVVSGYIYHLYTTEPTMRAQGRGGMLLHGYMTYDDDYQKYLNRVDEKTGLMTTFSRMNGDITKMVAEYRFLQARAKYTPYSSAAFCMHAFERDFNGTAAKLGEMLGMEDVDLFVRQSQPINIHKVVASNSYSARTHVNRDSKSMLQKKRLLKILEDDLLARAFLDEMRVLLDMSCLSTLAPAYHPYKVAPNDGVRDGLC